jgi:hypothetical protein
MNPEDLARFFHETYERLAPEHGYETRKESAVAWEDVPEQNRNLMVATCKEVLAWLRQEAKPNRESPVMAEPPSVSDVRRSPPLPPPTSRMNASAQKDPHVGWYEYRGARFEVRRHSPWGGFSYYVGDIKLPWDVGTLGALHVGHFAWTGPRMIRKTCRVIDKEYRSRERNGESTELGADRFDNLLFELERGRTPEGLRIIG